MARSIGWRMGAVAHSKISINIARSTDFSRIINNDNFIPAKRLGLNHNINDLGATTAQSRYFGNKLYKLS